ncbi:MAG TPA: DDE-type integrase/transposase/recombinase [Candidatus Binataceae bacterium]|nr:DDE-type integrase/transposase/recombinase [Candidatus Binataceae bacterium]
MPHADITYIAIGRGFVYLAVILDAWSRRVVGYALGRQIDTRLTLAALRAAISFRHPPPGLIHHSDRGAQYAAQPYRNELAAHGMVGSMGRRGNPYDNGKAESFMKTLKCEEVYLSDYHNFEEVIARLPHFIDQVTTDTGCTRLSVISRRCSSNKDGARPSRVPLGQHQECWPARCITRRPRIQNRVIKKMNQKCGRH